MVGYYIQSIYKEVNMTFNWGLIFGSLILGITAIGSGFGTLISGQAAIGAWKKCILNNRPAPMMFMAFMANPVTQVFYSFILMGQVMEAVEANPSRMMIYVCYSAVASVVFAVTAVVQGKAAAYSVDALAETRKGFAQYMAVMGAIESIPLFTMVFTIASL
jgi:V/A-type H+-transporting ATPase subunit K